MDSQREAVNVFPAVSWWEGEQKNHQQILGGGPDCGLGQKSGLAPGRGGKPAGGEAGCWSRDRRVPAVRGGTGCSGGPGFLGSSSWTFTSAVLLSDLTQKHRIPRTVVGSIRRRVWGSRPCCCVRWGVTHGWRRADDGPPQWCGRVPGAHGQTQRRGGLAADRHNEAGVPPEWILEGEWV